MVIIKVKELPGTTVRDKNAFEVGKAEDDDFDHESGSVTDLLTALHSNPFSKNITGVHFEDISTPIEYIIQNREMPKKEELKN